MDGEFPPIYIREFPEVFDRFTFDYLFRRLLFDGYDHEAAKEIILFNCALSSLVMQERLDNKYYLKMKTTDGVAPDLLAMLHEELMKKPYRWN
jgi:hypothetical protein